MATVTQTEAVEAAEALADEIARLLYAGAVLRVSDGESTRELGQALVEQSTRLVSIGRTLCAERTN